MKNELLIPSDLQQIASGEESTLYFDENNFYRLTQSDTAHFSLKILENLTPKLREKLIQTKLYEGEFSNLSKHQTILIHKKIKPISYPHEWCALMFKDAALFHLRLQMELAKDQLYLKDAHPWNVLFDQGKFIYVDIPSLVNLQGLKASSHLTHSFNAKQEKEEWFYFYQIMHSMFIPYFFKPLCGYAYGKRAWIKHCIEVNTLHCATSQITFRNCLPAKPWRFHQSNKLLNLMLKICQFNHVVPKKSQDLQGALQQLYSLVESIPVEQKNSAYKAYYAQKNAWSSYDSDHGWCQKQKSVYQVLQNDTIQTVMDVACNTGWYSILAAKLGKKVVALDIDEACIETLYTEVKKEALDILPLHCSITHLTQDRYAIQTGKRVLIDFAERMQSDVVLALGILHHLVLGEGLSFDDVLSLLKKLTKKQLVVEFIDIQDEKIVEEPSFFKAFFNHRKHFEFYHLTQFLALSKKYFSHYEIRASNPDTRKIIILTI